MPPTAPDEAAGRAGAAVAVRGPGLLCSRSSRPYALPPPRRETQQNPCPSCHLPLLPAEQNIHSDALALAPGLTRNRRPPSRVLSNWALPTPAALSPSSPPSHRFPGPPTAPCVPLPRSSFLWSTPRCGVAYHGGPVLSLPCSVHTQPTQIPGPPLGSRSGQVLHIRTFTWVSDIATSMATRGVFSQPTQPWPAFLVSAEMDTILPAV